MALPFVDTMKKKGENRGCLNVPDFVKEDSKNEVVVRGCSDRLNWLSAHLHLGWHFQKTKSSEFLCALYALEITLKPIYQFYNKTPPSFERLDAILKSQNYDTLAYKKIEDFDAGTEQETENLRKILLTKDTLNVQAIPLILQILRDEDCLRIALGVITTEDKSRDDPKSKGDAKSKDDSISKDDSQPENRCDSYDMWILDEHCPMSSGATKESSNSIHGVAWLINDNIERLNIQNINHWSTIAPCVEIAPKDPAFAHLVDSLSHPRAEQSSVRLRDPLVKQTLETSTEQPLQQPSSLILPPIFSEKTHLKPLPTLQESTSALPNTIDPGLWAKTFSLGPEVWRTKRRRSLADELAAEHVAKRFVHGLPEHVEQLPMHTWRKASVESMEGVEMDSSSSTWNSITEHDQAALRASHNLPPDSQICNFNGVAHITASMQKMNCYGTRRMLYTDVEGIGPRDHPPMNEVDPHNFLMNPMRWIQEFQRAEELSRQQIWNAPSFYEDLPWGKIEQKQISFEELIIYFPNHVTRWPYLALYLRMKNWNRLFFRVARLINKARGSHYQDDRSRKHVEVLPLMMKIQRAIQEILPTYTLSDHHLWHETLSREDYEDHILTHLKTKPRNFPSHPTLATIGAAAGYMTGENEFQHRPFSTSVLHLQPNRPPPRPKDPFSQYESDIPSFAKPLPRQVMSSPLPKTSRSQPEPTVFQRTLPVPERKTHVGVSVRNDDKSKSQVCSYGLKCIGIGQWCLKSHTEHPKPNARKKAEQREQGQRQINVQAGDVKRTNWQPLNCVNDADCADPDCRFLHPRRNGGKVLQAQPQSSPLEKKKKTACKFGTKCRDPNSCIFLHPGQAGLDEIEQQSHQAGTSRENADKSIQQDRRKKLCRFDPCTHSNCPFGHRSPVAPTTIHWNASQWCKFGAECINSKCTKNHPGPMTKQAVHRRSAARADSMRPFPSSAVSV